MTPRRVELLSAVAWAAFGALLLVASWRMDRLESQGVTPWSAPGLTPGIVGLLILVFALALAWQALRGRGGAPERIAPPDEAAPGTTGTSAEPEDPSTSGQALIRMLVAAAMCVAFAGISLGHGLPFQVEAAIFILVFTAVFRWREWQAGGRIGRGLVQTAAIAIVAAVAIGWLFESVFLVRLP